MSVARKERLIGSASRGSTMATILPDLARFFEPRVARATRELARCLATVDEDASYSLYEEAAGRGDPVALRVLGMEAYRRGELCASRDWLFKSIAVGEDRGEDPIAFNNLAVMLFEGLGGARDPQAARTLLKVAAGHGSAPALCNYACALYQGDGGPVDLELARLYFLRAAVAHNDPIGSTNFAHMLLRGEGRSRRADDVVDKEELKRDASRARELLQRAACQEAFLPGLASLRRAREAAAAKNGSWELRCLDAWSHMLHGGDETGEYLNRCGVVPLSTSVLASDARHVRAASMEALEQLEPLAAETDAAASAAAGEAGPPRQWDLNGRRVLPSSAEPSAGVEGGDGSAVGSAAPASPTAAQPTLRSAPSTTTAPKQSSASSPVTVPDPYRASVESAVEPHSLVAGMHASVEPSFLVAATVGPDSRVLACGANGAADFGELWVGQLRALRQRDAVVTAMVQLGIVAAQGLDGARSLVVARQWFSKAAAQGHPTGLMVVARMCMVGLGGEVDLRGARAAFGQAAMLGIVEAMRKFADMCAAGLGGHVNLKSARLWRAAAAELGDVGCMVSFGAMLRAGEGGEVDLDESRRWFLAAAVKGDALAQCHVAFMMHMGEGGPKNLVVARAWYRKSATQPGPHRAVAQTALGSMFNDGEGGPRDAKAARLWFTRAAVLGQPQAQQMLGIMLFMGEGGREDRDKARVWLALSAEARGASQYWHEQQSGRGSMLPLGPRQGFPCMEAGIEARRTQSVRKEAPDGTILERGDVAEGYDEGEQLAMETVQAEVGSYQA